MAKKTGRAKHLLKLIPVALGVSGLSGHNAIALEAPGNNIVGYLGSALENGYLNGAQLILDTVFACGVRAVVVGDLTLTMQELDLLITAMAGGDRSGWTAVEAAFQSVREGADATFITDNINVDGCVTDLIDVAAASTGNITGTGGFADSSQI
jgi:hypothetical protein